MKSPGQIAVSINTAAAMVEVSSDVIRRAVHAWDPNAFPPPLRAKKMGRKYTILVKDLEEWWESLPDG